MSPDPCHPLRVPLRPRGRRLRFLSGLFAALGLAILAQKNGRAGPAAVDRLALRDGKTITTEELLRLFAKQRAAGETATRLDLSGATLNYIARFPGTEIYKVNFEGAKLRNAGFSSSIFIDCNLRAADAEDANFVLAEFRDTSLSGIKAKGAYFDGIHVLSNAGQRWSVIKDAELEKTHWNSAILDGVRFIECELNGAVFGQWFEEQAKDDSIENHPPASLRGARFVPDYGDMGSGETDTINHANFDGCDLREAVFEVGGADVKFDNANLTDAKIAGTFPNVSFVNSNLSGVRLRGNFKDAVFEPAPGMLPFLPSLVSVNGLESFRYKNSPVGLTELRAALKTAGMRDEERKVNYAILRERYSRIRQSGNRAEYWFSRVLFDLPCGYGLYPWRPLLILVGGVFLFGVLYLPFVLLRSKTGRSGIWKIRLDNPVHKRRASRPIPVRMRRLQSHGPLFRRVAEATKTVLGTLGSAWYFSLLAAFSIGFREINVGSWILRMQTREYTLRATGWARVVGGVQSLLSVYLIALWLLTYFGRPFD